VGWIFVIFKHLSAVAESPRSRHRTGNQKPEICNGPNGRNSMQYIVIDRIRTGTGAPVCAREKRIVRPVLYTIHRRSFSCKYSGNIFKIAPLTGKIPVSVLFCKQIPVFSNGAKT